MAVGCLAPDTGWPRVGTGAQSEGVSEGPVVAWV
jgi:hypothetical protein